MSKDYVTYDEILKNLTKDDKSYLQHTYATIQQDPALLMRFARENEITIEQAYAALKAKIMKLAVA